MSVTEKIPVKVCNPERLTQTQEPQVFGPRQALLEAATERGVGYGWSKFQEVVSIHEKKKSVLLAMLISTQIVDSFKSDWFLKRNNKIVVRPKKLCSEGKG